MLLAAALLICSCVFCGLDHEVSSDHTETLTGCMYCDYQRVVLYAFVVCLCEGFPSADDPEREAIDELYTALHCRGDRHPTGRALPQFDEERTQLVPQ